jgi:hypothetical protein
MTDRRPKIAALIADAFQEEELCVPKIRFCNIDDEGRRGQVLM